MSKYILFIMLIIGLGAFLYYTTIYEVESIKIENKEDSCDEIVFNPFPVNHSFPISRTHFSKDKNYFNNGTLDWQKLGIHTIPDSFFYDYPCIEVLDLKRNELKEFSTSIRFLKNLIQLNLANNELKTLPKKFSFYKEFPQLEYLDLTANQISEFPLELFIAASRLNQIILDSNQIKTFPNASLYNVVYNDAFIEKISLNHNQIQRFPILLSRFRKLDDLDLKDNQVQGAVDITDFESLKYLDLQNNYVINFILNKENANILKVLDFRENQLKYFEHENLIYHNLNSLYLDDNQLKKLTLSTAIFPEIERVWASDNQLEKLEIPSMLPTLENLRISNNNIKSFSDLENAPNLTNLDISRNQLTEVPKAIFKMNSLKEFRCLENNISGIFEWSNSKIKRINLYDNNIEKVILKNNPNLWEINISRNNLKSFSIDQITLKTLSYLKMDYNPELTDIPIEYILKNAPNLKVFSVHRIGISGEELKKYRAIAEENNISFWYSNRLWED